MSIADDLRAAAPWLNDCCAFALEARLRAHADTIERVKKEMREHKPGCLCGGLHIREWANALKGETK